MEQKYDTGEAKVFENLAYGVRETPVAPEKCNDNDHDKKEEGFWYSLCCGVFGY